MNQYIFFLTFSPNFHFPLQFSISTIFYPLISTFHIILPPNFHFPNPDTPPPPPQQWRIQDYELGGRDWYTQAEGLCDEAAGFAGGGMEGGVPPPRLAKNEKWSSYWWYFGGM